MENKHEAVVICLHESNFRQRLVGLKCVFTELQVSEQHDLCKMRKCMSESVLTILPVGLRQLTGRLFQPNPFLFTLWIIGLVGNAALVVPKPKKINE